MGAGKKKAHESFSVAPSVTEAPVMPEGLAPLTEVDLDAIAAPSGDAAIALDAYNDALAMATQIANSPDASKHGGKKSHSGSGNAKQGGTTAQHKAAGRKGGKAAAKKS